MPLGTHLASGSTQSRFPLEAPELSRANQRLYRTSIDQPWLAAKTGILLALFALAHVVAFESTPYQDSPASTALTRSPASITVYVRAAATRYDVPEKLIVAIIAVESDFNPRAVSRKGATGLMQLMPETAATVGVRNRLDAPQNIDGGVRHLRALMDRYANDLPLVLAAYNAGEHPVRVYRGIPPYPETRRFVVRVLRRLGDQLAVEKVLAQSAPRGRRGPGRGSPPVSKPSREAPAPAAGARDVPEPNASLATAVTPLPVPVREKRSGIQAP